MAENSHTRILGVDYGSKRIGLAISDPLSLIATPYKAVNNDLKLIATIKEIIDKENIKLIVIGMPFNLKGQEAVKAVEVQKFIDDLTLQTTVEVIKWDERFTTTIAQKAILTMGVKKKLRQKKDGKVDSMAAALILQGYLDNKNHFSSR